MSQFHVPGSRCREACAKDHRLRGSVGESGVLISDVCLAGRHLGWWRVLSGLFHFVFALPSLTLLRGTRGQLCFHFAHTRAYMHTHTYIHTSHLNQTDETISMGSIPSPDDLASVKSHFSSLLHVS